MKKSIRAFLIIIIFTLPLAANEKIFLDNHEIHQYKGKLGKWELVASQSMLANLVKKYNTTLEEVKSINESISYSNHIFINYSDEYLKELEDSGKKRLEVDTDDGSFIWPISQIDSVSSPFGIRNGHLHTGVDIPAARGTAIVAVKDGMVTASSYCDGHGKSIVVEHRNNYFTRYSHNSVMLVKKGDYVKKGQIIAFVGSTGNSTGNHLHFEIRYKDIPLDPLDFLPENEKIDRVHLIKNWK